MTLTVNSEQLSLATKPGVECVPLIVLQTYSDRDAGTIDQTRYWTRTGRAVTYKYDGTNDQTFDPVVEFVSPISRGFNHLPDSDAYEIRDAIRLEVDGGPRAGVYLWRELLTENVIGARVTISSLLIDPTHTSHDLGLASAQHTVRYRGEITRLTDIAEQGTGFSLVCESPEAKLTSSVFVPGDQGGFLPFLLDATADVVCLGSRTAFSGSVTGSTLTGGGTASAINVLWTNNRYPTVLPGNPREVRIWADDPTFSEKAEFESITDPGANGAPEADLTNVTTSNLSGSFAFSADWDFLTVRPRRMRYAICKGYVRGLTRAILEVQDQSYYKFGGQSEDLVEGTYAVRWFIDQDETDPDNVISYFNIWDVEYPSGTTSDDWYQAIERPEYCTLTVDVESVWATPSGSFSTLFDFSTGTPASAYYAIGAGAVTPTASTAWIPSLSQYAISTTADGTAGNPYPQAVGIVFDQTDFPSAITSDTEVNIELEIPSADQAKVDRILVLANMAGTVATEDEVRRYQAEPDGGDYQRIYPEDIDVSQLITIKSRIAVPTGGYVSSLEIKVYWNEETTNKSILLSSPVFRSLSTTTAVNHPIDQADLIISDFVPGSPVSVDSSSFATAKTNTPVLNVTPDLSRYPTLGELLAAIGFASRINFVYAEASSGTVVKAFAAETDYDFPAPSRALGNEFDDLRLTLRPITEVANSFSWSYDLLPGTDSTYAENYRASFTANQYSNPYSPTISTATFTASEVAFGRREAIDVPIAMIRDEASALDVTGYYVKESLRGQVERYSCVVPYWLGYDLEPGDIVSILPAWETANQKVRILRVVFDFDRNAVGLVLESVT